MTVGSTDPPEIQRIFPVGEDGLIVEFVEEVSPQVNQAVRQLAVALEQAALTGVIEIVPAYRSLLVSFDPQRTGISRLQAMIPEIAERLREQAAPSCRLFRIPTVYGGVYGPDLAETAAACGLSADAVTEIFSTRRYPVYCLGFLCCLPYLGGVPLRLQFPRLATPRVRVPAGSVGIANAQAVVLPIELPSGFRYLGRTFVSLYDPKRFPPTPIRPGDFIEFPAVTDDRAREFIGHFPRGQDPGGISRNSPGQSDDRAG